MSSAAAAIRCARLNKYKQKFMYEYHISLLGFEAIKFGLMRYECGNNE